MRLWPIAVVGGAAVIVAIVASSRGTAAPASPFSDLPPPPEPDAPRGERERVGAPVSQRDAVGGAFVVTPEVLKAEHARDAQRARVLAAADLPELLEAAFESGADSVYISRDRKTYRASISAYKTRFDDNRSVSTHASALGKASTPEAAVRDALGQLTRDGRDIDDAVRRKTIGGRR